jgi:hypothetical protein
MNPRRALPRVRLRHCANQHADVRRHGSSSHGVPALPGPPQPKAPAMPGYDGFRLDDPSAVSHRIQMREGRTQSKRSVFASCNPRGWARRSTWSWCRSARTSSWSPARERAHVRRVIRRDSNTGIIVRKRMHRRPQHQLSQQEGTFPQGLHGIRQIAHAPQISRGTSGRAPRSCRGSIAPRSRTKTRSCRCSSSAGGVAPAVPGQRGPPSRAVAAACWRC